MRVVRILQRMPRLELKPNKPHNPQPAALSDPARLLTKEEIMKSLDTIFAVLAWIVFGIVIWAVSPFLMKLMEMATNLHNLFK